MKTLWVVAGALIDSQGKVLMTSRPEGKEFSGCWEFPGGKIEEGETPEDALIRELKEELAVQVEKNDLEQACFVSFPYKNFHLVMLLYVCRRWKGTPIPLENQKIDFVFPEKIEKSYPLPPADADLILRLKKYLTY